MPNAGFDVATGEWKVGSDRFLAPVKVLASRFRRRFVEELAKAHADGRLAFHGSIAHLADPRAFAREMKQVRQTGWKVCAKRPFNGPEAVVRQLSRHTRRGAISDARLLAFDGDTVTFRWRKPVSKPGDRPFCGTMALSTDGFIRRFLPHRIPKGFHRIRHFGILANGCRARTLQAVPDSCRRETGLPEARRAFRARAHAPEAAGRKPGRRPGPGPKARAAAWPASLRPRDMTGTPVGTRQTLRSRDRIVTPRASRTGHNDRTPRANPRMPESRPESRALGISAKRRTGRSVVRTEIQRST